VKMIESDRPNLVYKTVPLSTEQIKAYYNGFSNVTSLMLCGISITMK